MALPCLAIAWLDAGGVADVGTGPPTAGIVVYTSVPAVDGAVRRRPLPWTGTRALAIGSATAAALVAAGQAPVSPPIEPYTSEALLAWLLDSNDAPPVGDGVTIVKGAGGRDALATGLRAAGVRVRTLETYRRVRPAPSPDELAAALSPVPDIVSTTSDEGLDNLLALAGPRASVLRRLPLVVNGDRAAAHARARGFAGDVLVATPPGDAGHLAALRTWLRAREAAERAERPGA